MGERKRSSEEAFQLAEECGFDKSSTQAALEKTKGNPNEAMEMLLKGWSPTGEKRKTVGRNQQIGNLMEATGLNVTEATERYEEAGGDVKAAMENFLTKDQKQPKGPRPGEAAQAGGGGAPPQAKRANLLEEDGLVCDEEDIVQEC